MRLKLLDVQHHDAVQKLLDVARVAVPDRGLLPCSARPFDPSRAGRSLRPCAARIRSAGIAGPAQPKGQQCPGRNRRLANARRKQVKVRPVRTLLGNWATHRL